MQRASREGKGRPCGGAQKLAFETLFSFLFGDQFPSSHNCHHLRLSFACVIKQNVCLSFFFHAPRALLRFFAWCNSKTLLTKHVNVSRASKPFLSILEKKGKKRRDEEKRKTIATRLYKGGLEQQQQSFAHLWLASTDGLPIHPPFENKKYTSYPSSFYLSNP